MGHFLSLRFFSSFEVSLDGQSGRLATEKSRALLCYLATEASQLHTRVRLAGLLWPDIDGKTARNNLRQALLLVRKGIGDTKIDPPFLYISRNAIQFNQQSGSRLDVADFLQALETAATYADKSSKEYGELLETAVSLYRGRFMEQFYLHDSDLFDDWLTNTREWLHRLAEESLEKLIAYHIESQNWSAAESHAQRLLNFDPWREDIHRQLMQIYWSQGQRSAALAQYDICRQLLDDELGVPPEAETTAVYEQILAGTLPSLKKTAPITITPPSAPVNNLPHALTNFVGREREIEEAVAYLQKDGRLLTLSGTGGTGKTRLAEHIAHRCFDDGLFADGVYWVDLDVLEAAEPVAERIATHIAHIFDLALTSRTAVLPQLTAFFQNKEMLLVLDNFEHLLSGSSIVTALLRAAPQLRILTTSRERLQISGEQVVMVAGLETPLSDPTKAVADFGAIQLFVQMAQAENASFAPTVADWPAIAKICHLVSGLPLAIQLAASWTVFLSCVEIAEEIEQNLDFLHSQIPGVPQRQDSLRAVFSYSWQSLTAVQKEALNRLSVLRGDFGRQAAQAVSGASLPTLMALVNKSLVQLTPDKRYRLLPLVQQFAAEGFGIEADAVLRKKAQYFLRSLQQWQKPLRSSTQLDALAAIHRDLENIHSAWRWASRQQDATALSWAIDSLFHFYDMQSWFREGAEMFGLAEDAFRNAKQPLDKQVQARVAARYGWFCFHLGEQEKARALLQKSLTTLRSLELPAEMIFPLNYLGAMAIYAGEHDAVVSYCLEALQLATEAQDLYQTAVSHNIMGQSAMRQGDYLTAKQHHEQSLAAETTIGNRYSMAFSLTNLGKVAQASGDFAEAQQLFQRGLDIRQQMGDVRGQALCYEFMGDTARIADDNDLAEKRYLEALQDYRAIGNQWGIVEVLTKLAAVALEQGESGRKTAVSHLHTALQIGRATESHTQTAAIAQLVGQIANEPRWVDNAHLDEITAWLAVQL
ncbi:MAG: BTAD domain-containing putative transcriptional regulator [Chloroflexota bacterium]